MSIKSFDLPGSQMATLGLRFGVTWILDFVLNRYGKYCILPLLYFSIFNCQVHRKRTHCFSQTDGGS